MEKIPCTVGILTYDSATTLERCLASLDGFGEVLIADGGSTDQTLAIAARFGCRVIAQSSPGHPITDFGLERERLLDAASYDWFFYIDSDEYLSPELKEEIRAACTKEGGPLVYRVPWRVTDESRGIAYRSFKPYYQHRFFNKRSGAHFDRKRKIHERIVFDMAANQVGTFAGCWYVPLDVQLAFKEYQRRVDHRIRIMVAHRPPRTFLDLLRRVTYDPGRNVAKQAVKFIILRLRYPSRELVPAHYELYKLYSEWVFVKEAVRQYGRHLRSCAKTLAYSGAYAARSIMRPIRRRQEVVVLMYHAIDDSGAKLAVRPEEFERQMSYLAKKRVVVRLEDIVAYARGKRGLPENAVAITFDDGYRDIGETVLPILKRYRLPATVFLPTDMDAYADPAKTPRLSWDEARSVAESGLVSFEAHGRTHRALPPLAAEGMREESEGARRDLERELGKAPRYFAYPFGARSEAAEAAVEAAGYEAAFGITEGLVERHAALFRLPRVQVDGTMSLFLFKLRLTGAVTINRFLIDRFRAIVSR